MDDWLKEFSEKYEESDGTLKDVGCILPGKTATTLWLKVEPRGRGRKVEVDR